MRTKTTAGVIHNKSLARQIVDWRFKGEDVSQVNHPEDLMKLAKLDWKVELQEVKTENGTPTPWRQAVRVDNSGEQMPLSIVPKKNWQALPNYEFCQRALDVAAGFKGRVARAGWTKKDTDAVGQSSFLWAMVTPGDEIEDLAAEKEYEGYKPLILITSGTSYGIGYNARILIVRSCCQNGMINLQSTRVRGTHATVQPFTNFTFDEVKDSVKKYQEERELLLNTNLSEVAAYTWFIRHFGEEAKIDQPLEKQPQKLRELWMVYKGEADMIFSEAGIDLGQTGIKDSYWGVLQAVIAHNNHFGPQSSDNKLVEILTEARGKEMEKVKKTLAEAALQRQKASGGVAVGVRAWR
jgi:hypothetical protein